MNKIFIFQKYVVSKILLELPNQFIEYYLNNYFQQINFTKVNGETKTSSAVVSDPLSSGSEKENNAAAGQPAANRKRKIASLSSSSETESEDPEYVPAGKMFRPEGRFCLVVGK